MKFFKYFFIFLITYSICGCASLLNPKYQSVYIEKDEATNVYQIEQEAEVIGAFNKLEQKLKVVDSTSTIDLHRDMEEKRFIAKKDGFKDEYFTVFQEKRSPLYFVSWFPGIFLMFIPPLLDMGVKSYDYLKSYNIDVKHQYFEMRTENQKNVIVNELGFADTVNFLSSAQGASSYHKGKPINKNSITSFGYQPYTFGRANGYFNEPYSKEALNYVLTQRGYIDTTRSMFNNDFSNSVFLSGFISSYTDRTVRYNSLKFSVVDIEINWDLKDIYGNVIGTYTTSGQSGEFPIQLFKFNKSRVISDALEVGLIELMKLPEMELMIVRDEFSEDTKKDRFDTLSLSIPSIDSLSTSEYTNAVFKIEGEHGSGSGFFISEDGYAITSYHVIADSSINKIVSSKGDTYSFDVIRFDLESDLALLKVKVAGVTALPIEGIAAPNLVEEIYAIGINAENSNVSMTAGIISGIRLNKSNQEIIQTDAGVNSGNSGGAITRTNGTVVGVINSKLIGYGIEGISFATPSYLIGERLKIRFE